ncbi:MAG: PilN domain-containing protein [Terriglobia bacterium]
MIRINLIQAPARETETKTSETASLMGRKELYPVLALVVCFGLVGLMYWSASHGISTLNRQLALEKLEAARLAALEVQNKHYQAQLAEINQHITVIQTLQENRTGPRDLMTLLGGAADRVNGVYLLSVNTQKGRLNIHGQSDNADAVANFIAALDAAGSFRDVALRRVFEDDRSTEVSFKFDLDCLYKPPVEVAASELPASPSASAGRPPGR